MKRKLIKQGSGHGLVVYLPKTWITQNNLKPKDDVEIIEIGNDLQILNKNLTGENNGISKKEIELDFKIENEKIIRIKLKNAYALGYNKFIINTKNNKIKEIVNSTIDNHLFNCELINEIDNQLTFEILGEIFPNKKTIYLDKIFFFIQNSLENIHQNQISKQTQKSNNTNFEKRINSNSNKVSLYENIYKRNINLNFTKNPTVISYLLSYLVQLDHTIVKLSKNNQTMEKKDLEITQNLINQFNQIHKIYLKKKYNEFEDISIILQNIQNQTEKEIQTSKNPLIKHELYQISRQMYLLVNPIIHLE